MKCLKWILKKQEVWLNLNSLKKSQGQFKKKLENFFYAEKPTGGPSHR